MQNLTISLVQCELAWESPADNRRQLETRFEELAGTTDLIVLPEMFTTGFSISTVAHAEPPGGDTELWLSNWAQRCNCAITGSIAVRDNNLVYNRMLFATPEAVHYYDKRHLFRMAGEHRLYSPGNRRVIVSWRGWRINLQVCYDLRFPVFSRNRDDYDLLLFVANWPRARRLQWRALLPARAIENQAYVAGVNCIGDNPKKVGYAGDSVVIAADGEILADMGNKNGTASVVLSGADLVSYRARFPCQLDADNFQLN